MLKQFLYTQRNVRVQLDFFKRLIILKVDNTDGGWGETQYGTVHVCNGILVNVVKIRYINLFFF